MHGCEMQEAEEDVGYAKRRTAALRVVTGRWNSLKRGFVGTDRWEK